MIAAAGFIEADQYDQINFRGPRRPSIEERKRLLREALLPITERAAELVEVLNRVFGSVLTWNALLHDDSDNPVEHHTTVLRHVLEIAQGQGFAFEDIRRLAAVSLLHDNWPAKKVTRAMRQAVKNDEERRTLERLNRQYRLEHMSQGSEVARQLLQQLRDDFDDVDVETICAIISIHDNPTIDVPIPREDALAVACREADRLWMQAPLGVRADLARAGVVEPTHQECVEQANKNLGSYRHERGLYDSGSEAFIDNDTFFRTRSGHQIFVRYRSRWAGAV